MLTDRATPKSNLAFAAGACDGASTETITHWFQPWPFGEICVAASPLGLRRITWSEDLDRPRIAERLRGELGDVRLAEGPPDDRIRRELDEYFAGERRRFEIPVDPRPSSAFQERVLRRVLHSRFGETMTYGEVAMDVGEAGAARAVGQVMATNPVPIVIPCHRVLPADRSLGRYSGGEHVKEFLLALEGVHLETPLLDASFARRS